MPDEVVDVGAAEGAVGGSDAGSSGGSAEEMVPKAALDAQRRETAQYRQKWGTLESNLNRLGPERAEAMLTVIDLYANDEEAAVEALKQTFGLTESQAQNVVDQQDGDKPITHADLEKFFSERDRSSAAQAEDARQTQLIQEEAKALGFTPGSRAYRQLCEVALTEFEGDLEAAAKSLYDEHDGIVKQARADMVAKKGEGIVPVTNGDATGGEPVKIKSFAEAERATKAALAGKVG